MEKSYKRQLMQAERPITIHFPGKLVIGNGTLNQVVDDIINLYVSKVLIVTIEPLLTTIASIVDVLKANNISVEIDTSIVQEPSFEDLEKLMEKASISDPDL